MFLNSVFLVSLGISLVISFSLSGGLQVLKRCLSLMLKFLQQKGQYFFVIEFILLLNSSGVESSLAASQRPNLSPGMLFYEVVGARACVVLLSLGTQP
jgi:hypothetical protein